MSLGIGVIGAGVMGADHVRTIGHHVARAHVTAVYDQDTGRAADAVAAVQDARVIADANTLIASPDVEAVIVASPDETHRDYVLACIDAGKPVLCEKPLAPTTEDCQRIVAAEQRLGRQLVQVGYMRRFDPAYADLKERFSSGELGAARLLHCAHRNPTAPGFFRSLMSITNAAVHEFDICRWLLDAEITRIQILNSQQAAPGTVLDPLFMVVETDQGQLIDIEIFVNAEYGYDIRAELVCEHGTLSMTPQVTTELRRAAAPAFAFAPDWRQRFAAAYRRQFQAWVDSVETQRPVGASAWDGLVATAIADAGCQSFETGRAKPVTLPQKPSLYA